MRQGTRNSGRAKRAVTVAAIAAAGVAVGTRSAEAAGPLTTVMSGLNNPYAVTFGPDGGLYVAEAGTGNNGLGSGPGFQSGNGTPVYFGETGSISRLLGGNQTRVVTGLPSVGPAGAIETTGLQGLTFDAAGNLYGAFGLGGVESQRTQLVAAVGATSPNAALLGQVVRFNLAANSATAVSDLVPYETQNYAANNPDGSTPEANPYALVALPGGGFAASDGGGNVVLKIAAAGGAPTLLSDPPAMNNPTGIGGPTYQTVPTGLALDGAGKLYVGEFTGFPFPVGGANVLAINGSTGALTPFAKGFTTIAALTFGPSGDLYVLDETTNGLLAPPSAAQLFDYNPATSTAVLLANLPANGDYTGLTMGPDNALYIAAQGTTIGGGQVLRYSLAAVPEPSAALLVPAVAGVTGLLGRRRREMPGRA